jgi:hypothetical protein
MEEDKEEALEHLIFYINEFYAIKNTTMDLFLLFRKSEAEITKGKEAIEFEIRGRISFLTHWTRDWERGELPIILVPKRQQRARKGLETRKIIHIVLE